WSSLWINRGNSFPPRGHPFWIGIRPARREAARCCPRTAPPASRTPPARKRTGWPPAYLRSKRGAVWMPSGCPRGQPPAAAAGDAFQEAEIDVTHGVAEHERRDARGVGLESQRDHVEHQADVLCMVRRLLRGAGGRIHWRAGLPGRSARSGRALQALLQRADG